MTLSFPPPPAIPLEKIETHVKRAYGISGVFHPIIAERDQNFRLSDGKRDRLLKICAAGEGFSLAEAQVLALSHIAATDKSLPVPRVAAARSGNLVTSLEHDGVIHPVLLLDWLPGEVLGLQASAHLTELAALLARLGKSLRGFVHPAIVERQLVWDVRNAPGLLPYARMLKEAWRDQAVNVLTEFRDQTLPALARLRAQTIHGDVHPYNVLLGDAARISGIIDFGDMIHAPLVIDPANVIADCLEDGTKPAQTFEDVLRSYCAITPLEHEEAALIVPLVEARFVSTLLISYMRVEAGAAQTLSIAEISKLSLAALAGVQAQRADLMDLCLRVTGHRSAYAVPKATILQRRKAAMGPDPLLFYDTPLHMVKGDGIWLEASSGRRYLDCYNNVAHVGHAHPVVAGAVSRQLHRLNTNTRYLTDEATAYAEALKDTVDPSLDTVIFVNSGSEANDVAWRMAKVFTGHRGALCTEFAYHGITHEIDAVSPSNYPPGKWHQPHVRLLPPPDVYRHPVQGPAEGRGEAYAALAGPAIRDLQQQGLGVAMAIIDSAFMTNGILDAPQGYLKGLVQRVRGAGGLFVADEVQSGFGRMGSHMWGHQRQGIVPDFVTIGKPAGNGYPLGAIITRAEILQRFAAETGPFFSTFGGGNAACVAGLSVLEVMHSEGLIARAETTGSIFRRELRNLTQRHEIIGDVRGAGLAIGVELVRNRKTLEPAREETRRILSLMSEEGVLIGSDGPLGNVLKIRPPLAIRQEHVPIAVEALDRVLARL